MHQFIPPNYAYIKSLLQLPNNLSYCSIECQLSNHIPYNQILGIQQNNNQTIKKIELICKTLGFLWPEKNISWSILPKNNHFNIQGIELGMMISLLLASQQLDMPESMLESIYFGDLLLNGDIFCSETSLNMIAELITNQDIVTNTNSLSQHNINITNYKSVFEMIKHNKTNTINL